MNEACCALAPVSADYETKGRWEVIAGVNTYVVGSETASRAIFDIYDVFGPSAQALQGADRLASLTSSLVLMPDLFDGKPLDGNAIPTDTEEKKKVIAAFRATTGAYEPNLEKLYKLRAEVGSRWPAVEDHVGIFGLCWGGKIGILACGESNTGKGRRFNVSGTAHPGALEAKDAEATNVPHILLASPGEPADVVAEIREILSKPGKVGEVETYSTMFHGWMGARANLKDEANIKEYERGYNQAAKFFSKYL